MSKSSRQLLVALLATLVVTWGEWWTWPVAILRAAPVIVQTKVTAAATISSAGTNASFDAPTAAGNAVIVCVAQGATGGSATIAVSDATNGTYANDVLRNNAGNSRTAAIRSFRNAASISTVTVTPATSGTGVIFLREVSGLDNGASVQTDNQVNTNTTDMRSGATGLSGTGFGVTCAQKNAGNSNTEGGAWTELTTTNLSRYSQHQIGTLATDDGPWTSGVSTDDSDAVMALFAEAATAGGGCLLGGGFLC
jgi:hypothetical protein